MKIKTIACINKKRAIGKDGKLMYNLPNDMENFKSLTMGNIVIMGRETFESLPGKKPLAGRINIILSRDKDFCIDAGFEDTYIFCSSDSALEFAKTNYPEKDVWVIGGSSVYKLFMYSGLVDEQYLTIVSDESDGDTYYPDGYDDEYQWERLYRSYIQRDKGNKLSYIFTVLKRKK